MRCVCRFRNGFRVSGTLSSLQMKADTAKPEGDVKHQEQAWPQYDERVRGSSATDWVATEAAEFRQLKRGWTEVELPLTKHCAPLAGGLSTAARGSEAIHVRIP